MDVKERLLMCKGVVAYKLIIILQPYCATGAWHDEKEKTFPVFYRQKTIGDRKRESVGT